MSFILLSGYLMLAGFSSCHSAAPTAMQFASITSQTSKNMQDPIDPGHLDTATFAEGCFWCTESFFQQLRGVKKVISGYSGGHVAHPTYEEVCTGTTGHAEACDIIYDPSEISYTQLLQAFWESHDPTTLDRQGNDIGTQYRSAIFYHNEQQKDLAEAYKKKLDASGAYRSPIVTSIEPLRNFYPAEEYHQDYYNLHKSQPYCQFVIRPKLEKFRKVFKDELKKK